MMRCFVIVGLLLSGCVSPTYQVPALSPERVAAEERRVLEEAFQTAMARRQRVYDLAWPVLVENTALCPQTRSSIGVVLADQELMAALAGGLRVQDMARLGVVDELTFAHVNAGSPAAQAGLRAGMVLEAVNGKAVAEPSEAASALREHLDDGQAVSVRVREGDTVADYDLHGQLVCDIAVKISGSDAINASAAGGDIVLHTGLIRALDDDALQFVIAHEAAHVALRHPRKYAFNAVVSGAAFAGPPVYFGAGLVDRLLNAVGREPDISVSTRAAYALVPWAEDFESEADYVGLYFYARSGGDIRNVASVFDVFSVESPYSIFARATHPLTPERLDRLYTAIEEIERKRDAGQDLHPDRAQ